MTLKQYIFMMLSATFLCWAGFLCILFNIDPQDTNFCGFVFFYASFFLAIVGTGSLLGLFLRAIRNKEDLPIFRLVTISYRQSVWLGILLTMVLLLQSKELLMWWNVLFLVVALTFIEFFFISAGARSNYL